MTDKAIHSLILCSSATLLVFLGGAIVPITNAGADINPDDYSKIDKRCITGIDRNVAIDLLTANKVQDLAIGTPMSEVTAISGSEAYCGMANKTAPNGTMSQPFVLPIYTQTIAAPPQVLIVYSAKVDGIDKLTGIERWNVAPDDWLQRQTYPQATQPIADLWSGAQQTWSDWSQPKGTVPLQQPQSEDCHRG